MTLRPNRLHMKLNHQLKRWGWRFSELHFWVSEFPVPVGTTGVESVKYVFCLVAYSCIFLRFDWNLVQELVTRLVSLRSARNSYKPPLLLKKQALWRHSVWEGAFGGPGMDIQDILSTCTISRALVTLGGYSQPQVNLVQVVFDAHPLAFSTLN